MASLYRRGRAWWIKYQHRGKVARQSLGTRSSTEARRLKRTLEYDLDGGLHRAPPETPLKAVLKDYLALLRSTRTRKSYKKAVSYLGLWSGPCGRNSNRAIPQEGR